MEKKNAVCTVDVDKKVDMINKVGVASQCMACSVPLCFTMA